MIGAVGPIEVHLRRHVLPGRSGEPRVAQRAQEVGQPPGVAGTHQEIGVVAAPQMRMPVQGVSERGALQQEAGDVCGGERLEHNGKLPVAQGPQRGGSDVRGARALPGVLRPRAVGATRARGVDQEQIDLMLRSGGPETIGVVVGVRPKPLRIVERRRHFVDAHAVNQSTIV